VLQSAVPSASDVDCQSDEVVYCSNPSILLQSLRIDRPGSMAARPPYPNSVNWDRRLSRRDVPNSTIWHRSKHAVMAGLRAEGKAAH
jgi:hypothetical protein